MKSKYGLRGKIAHFAAFSLFCFNSIADFIFYFVNLRSNVHCLHFYGIVQGHNTVKSHCRRQGSISNRWDGIKVEVSVSILRHRSQANFSDHTRTGKGMKLFYISCLLIPNEPIFLNNVWQYCAWLDQSNVFLSTPPFGEGLYNFTRLRVYMYVSMSSLRRYWPDLNVQCIKSTWNFPLMTTRWQQVVSAIVIESYSRKCECRLHNCSGLQMFFLNIDHPYFLSLPFLLLLNIML